jgi:hypothetical protein
VFSSGLLLLIAVLLNADACLDDNAEARWVNAHLSAAQMHANLIADNCWADRSKARTLTVLQDQISQARSLAETCRAALATVHQVMFPLNDQPIGLPDLLRRFKMGKPSTTLSINTFDVWLLLLCPSCESIIRRST